jgi:hypothetical protein
MYKKFYFLYKQRNLFDFFELLWTDISIYSNLFKSVKDIRRKTGIEIGGPSYLFRVKEHLIYPIKT